jgi:hypothetical protein
MFQAKRTFVNYSYRSRIMFHECETPDVFVLDQTWEFEEGGFILNKFSGMCMNGNVTDDPAVKLWPCERDFDTTYQKWQLTPESLKNSQSGSCSDENMKMVICTYTYQTWTLQAHFAT